MCGPIICNPFQINECDQDVYKYIQRIQIHRTGDNNIATVVKPTTTSNCIYVSEKEHTKRTPFIKTDNVLSLGSTPENLAINCQLKTSNKLTVEMPTTKTKSKMMHPNINTDFNILLIEHAASNFIYNPDSLSCKGYGRNYDIILNEKVGSTEYLI